MPALPGYYTTKEAAEKLGYKSSDSLKHYCQQGKIAGAVKVGKTWFIPETWVIHTEKTPVDPKGNRGIERKNKEK